MRKDMKQLKERLESVNYRIGGAAEACGRVAQSIRLVAVSKTMPVEIVKSAIDAGATTLGENYVQEAQEKITALSDYPVSWHFIGHLQTNKAKVAVTLFDLIHSVDSLKLAEELHKQAKKADKVQQILIQVNIGQDRAKSGTTAENTLRLVKKICRLENVSVRGLMTMLPFFDEPERGRPYFKALSELRDHIRKEKIPNVSMDELSMGMTGDFEVAIEYGATLVRIGTAIFGRRN